jgi:cell wall-associated NlpC family hydrolase
LKERFIEELKKQIGVRYALGGGQMKSYKGIPNKDKNGYWVGYDCCGGIMHALREATGIKLKMRNVPGMMIAPWQWELSRFCKPGILEAGDLIFVDIPNLDENGDVMRDEDGYPVYGRFNHVMTYIGKTEKGDIITTKGAGGDYRMNPDSKTVTGYWTLDAFQGVSARIFEDTTRYVYARIDWQWLKDWKQSH